MKRKFRVLAGILCALIIVSFANLNIIAQGIFNIDEDSIVQNATENIYNKIHFYFGESEHDTIDNLDELTEATELLNRSNYDNNAYNINNLTETHNEVQMTVQFESDFMQTEAYKNFSEERNTLKTMDEVRDFRRRLNTYSKQYHKGLIDANIQTLSKVNYTELKAVDYSPFVVMNISAEDVAAEALQELALNDKVCGISLSYEPIAEEAVSWDSAMFAINAKGVVSRGTYTGEGVRIGIYEAGGVCDINHVNFIDKDITLRGTSDEITTHANQVTTVLTTIAPEAQYFVAEMREGDVGIEIFLDQLCDIVNCSYGFDYDSIGQSNSYKESIDGVIDYQISSHFITVVVSAGNVHQQNAEITSPGYAYNAITVGGVSQNSNGTWSHASGACYVSNSPTVKPNISAPFELSIPNMGSNGGTSFCAPQVSGCAALAMECNIAFATAPEMLLATMSATATKTSDYSEDVEGFDEKVGAGMINLSALLSTSVFINEFITNRYSNEVVISESVYLSEGQTINISAAWLTYRDGSDNVYVPDYEIYVYKSSNNVLLFGSLGTDCNVELSRYTITEAGDYRIDIILSEDIPFDIVPGHYLALTYYWY